jgi:hypothetical protein
VVTQTIKDLKFKIKAIIAVVLLVVLIDLRQ